jgi:branched-chain amino acid transport system permease protein
MSDASTTTQRRSVAAGIPRWLGTKPTRVLAGAGVVLVILAFFFAGDSWLNVLDLVLIYAVGTLGLNVLSGYTGQVSLGLAFFVGIGAYTAIVLGGGPASFPGQPNGLGLPFVIWLPAAGVTAAIAGALIGPTALRLKGFYLGIVTLSLAFIGQYIFSNLRQFTGGPGGAEAAPVPTVGSFSFAAPDPIFGVQLSFDQLYFALLVVIVLVVGVFVGNVARTRAGRAWQAVRDNEVAASIMGINLLTAKMGAFVLSSFLAGIAGALLASFEGFANYVNPTDALTLSIQFVAAVLIGGAASVWGSILGAAFVFGLPVALQTFSVLPQSAGNSWLSAGNLNTILYGLLIIVFLLFEPAGLIGLIRRAQVLIRRFEQTHEGGARGPVSGEIDAQSQLDAEITQLPRRTGPSLPGD